MYLRGSKWSMNKRRRRSNPWKIIILLGLIGGAVYFNQVIVPVTPPLFIPTPTATRPPESYVADASALADEGRFAQAINAYQEVLMVDPQNPAHYLEIARLEIYAARYEDAVTSAANALLLNPNSSMAFTWQAWAFGFLEQYAEAEQAINQAITLDPTNPTAYAAKAIILSLEYSADEGTINTLDDAVSASRTAISLAPDLMEALWARGLVLEITSNYTDAVASLQSAISLNPNIAELHMALGRNLRFLSDNEGAIEEFNRANALDPTNPLPATYISRTYANIGDYAKAVQFAEQALQNAPDDPYMHGNLGVMYFRNGQYEYAIPEFELAIRGGTTAEGVVVEGLPLNYGRIAEYYYSYGLALSRMGYCGDALQIAQTLQLTVANDETAVYNAQEMISICEQFMESGAATPMALQTPTLGPTPSSTDSTVTPTP